MSAGHFYYKQNHIYQIAVEIERLINENDDQRYGYSPKIIEKFHIAVGVLRAAYVYAQRIDWLVSSDDGPDTFLSRLKEELGEMK